MRSRYFTLPYAELLCRASPAFGKGRAVLTKQMSQFSDSVGEIIRKARQRVPLLTGGG